ncbi:nickel-responsive transcriptional regulator NikR [Vibrio mangrovi]|uniref:Putative nickel-responsive regulator n=1 Tax=Vibrio mangrovi TaxID=474394 RepID=A0A1Y6IVT6_9VIBR|nr:nickel-responsive transcriptional regulator NikR [Vibrio mangrovi]MDW6004850.1 nickel-responsive transcriptional regulator NikR [Vibrio mangrovi]SMS01141.1 Nickel-responsive regulator [Vibrio mangrovi]
MQRITITIDDDLIEHLDQMIEQRGYTSRSEGLRDLVRDSLLRDQQEDDNQPCLGVLSYLYEHNTRELARRLTATHHEHHDLSVSTLHMHVNHDDCLEVNILKGPRQKLQHFADSVISQRGVNHGSLRVIPVPDEEKHTHHS